LLNFTVMALLAVPLSLGALWRCGHVTGGLVTDWSFWQRPKLLSQLPMWKVVPFLIFSPWLNILRIVWWMPSILRLTVREWGLLFWWIPSTISLITTIFRFRCSQNKISFCKVNISKNFEGYSVNGKTHNHGNREQEIINLRVKSECKRRYCYWCQLKLSLVFQPRL